MPLQQRVMNLALLGEERPEIARALGRDIRYVHQTIENKWHLMGEIVNEWEQEAYRGQPKYKDVPANVLTQEVPPQARRPKKGSGLPWRQDKRRACRAAPPRRSGLGAIQLRQVVER